MNTSRNVVGGALLACSYAPLTGFYRTGCCETGADDLGRHLICVRVTDDFLRFSRGVGNDLSTPLPQYGFPGLVPGDRWCVTARCAPTTTASPRRSCWAPPTRR